MTVHAYWSVLTRNAAKGRKQLNSVLQVKFAYTSSCDYIDLDKVAMFLG